MTLAKYIDVDQNAVAKGEPDALNIRMRVLSTGTFLCVRASEVSIPGPSTVRYCPAHPKAFGARAWVEVDGPLFYRSTEFPNGQRME